MYPIIFDFGPIIISSFGVMMVIAFGLCNYLLKKDIETAGYDPSIGEDITFRAAIGGVVGAKLYYIIENIPTYGIPTVSLSICKMGTSGRVACPSTTRKLVV